MALADPLKRLQDVLRALWVYHGLRSHEGWSRERLKAHQQQRLLALVHYARAHSPFYSDLYAKTPIGDDLRLNQLPIIDKRTVMSEFDRLVTDPRLELRELVAHLDGLRTDDYYLGRYRVMATSGTSGLRGVFVFDRREWSTVLANTLRWNDYLGLRPRFPRRPRISTVGAQAPGHVSFRMVVSGDVGLFKIQRLDALSRLEDLISALNAFQPDALLAYASVAALLAMAQLDGRLRIRPRIVATHSELLTDSMARKIKAAWQTTPFNHYGLTELPNIGSDCDLHRGIHAFNDLFIAEVVDDENRPVPAGRPGSKLLLTNLYNYTQPLLRYEISDRLVMAPEACPCGRPFPLISHLAGRSEDTIFLPGIGAEPVPVPPVTIVDVIEADPQVTEYRVSRDANGLLVKITVEPAASREHVADRLKEGLRTSLVDLGVREPQIEVLPVDSMPRLVGSTGKVSHIAGSQ